ncbi:hypothetical protein [Clostridium thermobutyricum]|uniref:hypothetical protein n=1 Tax=Clostridium thermobutyricum TaxID=29372 RepID=UPI0018AC8605|nr:hypothetical protein [Clostridium thermobutyricum]
MKFNPFEEKPVDVKSTIQSWGELYPKQYQYNKNEVDPYTKTRIILMNGTEFEANWFSHQFSRHCDNNDLRREIAELRRIEKQQQMKISNLRPLDETILETTISYEQLAVDLTAALAKSEKDKNVKAALDFALLEDFDHLYRYADLLEMDQGVRAENLVGKYTEIMPGRPTIAHHRCPHDSMRKFADFNKADLKTKLNINIITAAEQQTMNYYMNVSSLYKNDIGRQLYLEIGMVEEQHVSQYASLKDPRCTWLEELLMHEYTEAYLYYSCYMTETDENIKKIWEQCLTQEIAHLHKAADLLKKYEKKEWQEVIPNADFPQILELKSNKDYVRDILKTVNLTADKEGYIDVSKLGKDSGFYKYQQKVNKNVDDVVSHTVIEKYIDENGEDYRYQEKPHPISELDDKKKDNTTVGRIK